MISLLILLSTLSLFQVLEEKGYAGVLRRVFCSDGVHVVMERRMLMVCLVCLIIM